MGLVAREADELLRICSLLAVPNVQLRFRFDVGDRRSTTRRYGSRHLLHQLLLNEVQPVQLMNLLSEYLLLLQDGHPHLLPLRVLVKVHADPFLLNCESVSYLFHVNSRVSYSVGAANGNCIRSLKFENIFYTDPLRKSASSMFYRFVSKINLLSEKFHGNQIVTF